MPPNAAAPAAAGVMLKGGSAAQVAVANTTALPKIAAGVNSNAAAQPMLSLRPCMTAGLAGIPFQPVRQLRRP